MPKLMDELRRRHVVKAAIAYLVAGWLILQVTDVVSGVIGLPEWTMKLVGFLFALGLPDSAAVFLDFRDYPRRSQAREGHRGG